MIARCSIHVDIVVDITTFALAASDDTEILLVPASLGTKRLAGNETLASGDTNGIARGMRATGPELLWRLAEAARGSTLVI